MTGTALRGGIVPSKVTLYDFAAAFDPATAVGVVPFVLESVPLDRSPNSFDALVLEVTVSRKRFLDPLVDVFVPPFVAVGPLLNAPIPVIGDSGPVLLLDDSVIAEELRRDSGAVAGTDEHLMRTAGKPPRDVEAVEIGSTGRFVALDRVRSRSVERSVAEIAEVIGVVRRCGDHVRRFDRRAVLGSRAKPSLGRLDIDGEVVDDLAAFEPGVFSPDREERLRIDPDEPEVVFDAVRSTNRGLSAVEDQRLESVSGNENAGCEPRRAAADDEDIVRGIGRFGIFGV